MELSLGAIGDVRVIRFRGKFTMGNGVEEFRSTTEALVKDGHRQFILSLAETPYMDSSAIGAVVRLTAGIKRDGGGVKLVNPSKMVIQTLKMVGLLNLFEVYPDEQTAALSFMGGNKPVSPTGTLPD